METVSHKLHKLWQQVRREQCYAVMLDIRSHCDIRQEDEALNELHSDYRTGELTWRGIPIEIHHATIEVSAVGDLEVTNSPIDYPKLIAIRYMRDNKRFAYLDDPDNSKEFL